MRVGFSNWLGRSAEIFSAGPGRKRRPPPSRLLGRETLELPPKTPTFKIAERSVTQNGKRRRTLPHWTKARPTNSGATSAGTSHACASNCTTSLEGGLHAFEDNVAQEI